MALVLLVVSIFLLGYYSTKSPLVSENNPSHAPILTLTNLPERFCPKTVQVVVVKEKTIASERVKPVDNCRTIDLGSLGNSTKVLFKLPQTLAFELNPAELSLGEYSPVIGDITNDNQINHQDEAAAKTALFNPSKDLRNDLDGDEQITVNDLVLIRLHEGVGVDRPDGRGWNQ